MDERDFECTYELCGMWFKIYDNLGADSLKCPACQAAVKQI